MSASSPELPATPPDNLSRTEGSNSGNLPQDLLLVVFVHGFKGTESTFGKFPERLRHVLSETIPNIVVETIVFPAYETKGDLNAAVIRFADWLTNLTVQREVANGVGGGAGKAKIILCGHSMGGLLIADALIEFVRTRPDPNAPLWPNIIACLAYDTPYFGLHPYVFKNTATQAADYVRTAQNVWSNLSFGNKTPFAPPVSSTPAAAISAPPNTAASATSQSIWSKWAPVAYAVGGGLIAGAAAGTAYYRREDIGAGYSWATDHMKYVGNLWDENTMAIRMDNLLKIEQQMGVMFRDFYTILPPHPPQHPNTRTFIVLPSSKEQKVRFTPHFLPAHNGIATDEISAHTGMFDAKANDGYYELGLLSAHLIRDVVVTIRSAALPVHPSPLSPSLTEPTNTKPPAPPPKDNVEDVKGQEDVIRKEQEKREAKGEIEHDGVDDDSDNDDDEGEDDEDEDDDEEDEDDEDEDSEEVDSEDDGEEDEDHKEEPKVAGKKA
ncbi:hypothetical protein BXZ70DRAFT_1004290 [Cristinia sonorae]|uniref:AB hydrolase-1 domain-containing protein n=1 Tax=Cristinia sonorae TaxID=1940300 RepID=A0A8K0XTU1_9AGAR|nr:hypothetical protein BXZ70DRAFT_1004290 [Cristinia sonorae]